MEPTQYDYAVLDVIRVIDGDTYELRLSKTLDFGFNITLPAPEFAASFRLLGVDTWERREPGGPEATAAAAAWMRDAWGSGVLRGVTHKSEGLVPDGAFGRWLIDLYRADTGQLLTDYLRAVGAVDESSSWSR